MFGQMQGHSLQVSHLIDYASSVYPTETITTKTVEGGMHSYTYKDAHKRSKQLAQALIRLGVQDGDVVGTLAWNTHRHYECWYGISGIGAILHTVNPRLFAQQINYIVNHGEDKYIFVDLTFIAVLETIQDNLTNVKGFIIMTDEEHMPSLTTLKNVHCYETLISNENGKYDWPLLDENQASSLCYTSGTTGNPKGVLYSHRSSVLHSWAVCSKSCMELGAGDSVLPIVPMFHANAWGLVYASAMAGARLVLPGPHLDGENICHLINEYNVKFTAAVPTVWTMLLNYMEENNKAVECLESVVIGGSAVPKSMIEKFEIKYGVAVWQVWGMTELSPLGTVNKPLDGHQRLEYSKQLDIKIKQGRPCYGVEIKIVDDQNNQLNHDGITSGNLMVRGPWVVDRYFKAKKSALDQDGWFITGDVATIDSSNNMHITDRMKDVIKSGGEWISSIDLENSMMGHSEILQAAVIGKYHSKWEERPLMVVIPKNIDKPPQEKELKEYLKTVVINWWVPDAIIFVSEIPLTATGKINKVELRKQFKDFRFEEQEAVL